jgi:hypothetical protein
MFSLPEWGNPADRRDSKVCTGRGCAYFAGKREMALINGSRT